MTTTQIDDAVRQAIGAIAPEADLSTIDPDERLRDALDIDSLDFVRMLEQLQNLTGVTVPERDYAKITTLHEVTTYVGARAT